MKKRDRKKAVAETQIQENKQKEVNFNDFQLKTAEPVVDDQGNRDYFTEYYNSYKNNYITQYITAYREAEKAKE